MVEAEWTLREVETERIPNCFPQIFEPYKKYYKYFITIVASALSNNIRKQQHSNQITLTTSN